MEPLTVKIVYRARFSSRRTEGTGPSEGHIGRIRQLKHDPKLRALDHVRGQTRLRLDRKATVLHILIIAGRSGSDGCGILIIPLQFFIVFRTRIIVVLVVGRLLEQHAFTLSRVNARKLTVCLHSLIRDIVSLYIIVFLVKLPDIFPGQVNGDTVDLVHFVAVLV